MTAIATAAADPPLAPSCSLKSCFHRKMGAAFYCSHHPQRKRLLMPAPAMASRRAPMAAPSERTTRLRWSRGKWRCHNRLQEPPPFPPPRSHNLRRSLRRRHRSRATRPRARRRRRATRRPRRPPRSRPRHQAPWTQPLHRRGRPARAHPRRKTPCCPAGQSAGKPATDEVITRE